LSKAADIYWDNGSTGYSSAGRRGQANVRTRRRAASAKAKPSPRTAPWWLSVVIVTSIFLMLCVSINYRAFNEMQAEVDENTKLAAQIQNITDENLALQEEIHTLRSNPVVIQREAKKIGMDLRPTRVSVPTN
jgi:cell division protein FtsL